MRESVTITTLIQRVQNGEYLFFVNKYQRQGEILVEKNSQVTTTRLYRLLVAEIETVVVSPTLTF